MVTDETVCSLQGYLSSAVLYDIVKKATMPQNVPLSLFDQSSGNCVSITGKKGANQHFDEFPEILGVRSTKIGSREGALDSFIQSFYTTAELHHDFLAFKDFALRTSSAAGVDLDQKELQNQVMKTRYCEFKAYV